MSHINTHTLTCPHCGKSAAQTVWDSVNVTLEPDVKERILAGHFFEFFCLDCGYHAPLLHPCLYHDMEQKLLIWYLPDGLEPEQAQQAVAALEPVRQALEPGVPATPGALPGAAGRKNPPV